MEWIDEGLSLMQASATTSHDGSNNVSVTVSDGFIPNYQTFSLTATCTVHAGANSCGRANFGQSDFHTPGCRTAPEAANLGLAKAAITAFDLALVVEHFELQGPSLLLQRAVGIPGLWLSHHRPSKKVAQKPIPPSVLKRLVVENSVDSALYSFARKKAKAAMKVLSRELLREHGAGMGGYDPFAPLRKRPK
jgi:hypothetical protein